RVPGYQSRVTADGEFIQDTADVTGVGDGAIEVNSSGNVALDELPVAVSQQFPEQRRPVNLLRWNVVFFDKGREPPVGIKQVTVLIGAVHRTVLERGEHFQ